MEEKATEKQIEFALKLGIKAPEQYSKGTLRELIDKAKTEKFGKAEEKPILTEKPGQKAPYGVFHLSPEEVRCRALEMAMQFDKEGLQMEDYYALAEGIEAWILR